MKKRCLTLAAALAAVLALAGGEPPPFDMHKKAVTPEEKAQRKAYFEKRFLEHTGGKILRPGTKQGEVVYVDCQKRAKRAWLEESVAYMAGYSKFRVSLKEGAFDLAAPKVEGNVSLFVVDDEHLPPLLVAPESRWAMVNVAHWGTAPSRHSSRRASRRSSLEDSACFAGQAIRSFRVR